MDTKRVKHLLVAPLGAVLIALVTVTSAQAAQIFYGKSEQLGNGYIRSFVELDDNGNPSNIGATLTQGALALPIGQADPDIVVDLSLPSEASSTAFKNIELTYRPYYYPNTPDVFLVPRLGFDFFQVSPQERDLICAHPDTSGPPQCVGNELTQALKTPDPGILPEGLVSTLEAQPRVGTRYFDPDVTFPIVQGQQPFTTTYDYGFYDGNPTLRGIGVTKAFLETQPNVTIPIKIPTTYSQGGYYPTSYSVTYDPASQDYRVAYSGLTYRRSIPELSPIFGLLALGAWGAVSQVRNKLKKQKLASPLQ